MELTFNGHACLTLKGRGGKVVLTDPYRSGAMGGRISHADVTCDADVVTISHYHVDHSHVTAALGTPSVVDRSGEAAGIHFEVIPTYHDRVLGTRMGMTSMVVFELDGLRIAHLGDIGCDLTASDVSRLGAVDVLIWPTGGVYTLGPEDAPKVLDILRPRVAIPVHFENERCRLGMAPVEALLPHVHHPIVREGGSRWSSADGLPAAGEIRILEPLL
jgi:L-ascorbate metabolism protein UlaG (beta-lactamase superfamily)